MTIHVVEHVFAGLGALSAILAGVRFATLTRRRRARRRGIIDRPIDGPPCPSHDEHDGRACRFRRGHPWPCWFGDADPKLLERV
jgi:hypothetical protein